MARGSTFRSSIVASAAAVVIAMFLAEHREELRTIPASVRAFSALLGRHGVVDLGAARDSAIGILIAAIIIVASYGAGHALLRVLRLMSGGAAVSAARPLDALCLARTCALGAGVWSLVWFALGLAGLYRPGTAVAALACGVVLAARAALWSGAHSSTGEEAGAAARPSSVARVAFILVALPVSLALAAACAPPTAKDTLQYHLALPKAFLAAGALVDVPGNIASYFPLGAEMLGVWAMLLGRIVSMRAGETAFGVVMFAFLPLLLAAVFGWARERGVDRDWAWLAAALVAGVPTVYEVAGSGYVDLALALYVTLAIRAISRWRSTQDRAHLAESAVFLGFALAVKLTALFVLLLFALIILARMRAARSTERPSRWTLGTAPAAVASAVVIGGAWYLRTWAHTGSPVFPFFASIWPGSAPGWDVERSAMLHRFNALYGGTLTGPVGYVLTPLSLSLTGQREVASAYEGVLGVSVLLAAALLVWALAAGGVDAELKIAAAAGGAFFVWWMVSAQVLRYLLPALPLIAVAGAGAAAARTTAGAIGGAVRWALVASIVAGELVMVAWAANDNAVLAATGAEPRDAYLERRLDYYPYYRVINERLAPDVKVWLIDVRRDTYHLERPYVGDYLFEDYTLRQWIEASVTADDVRRRARAAGISHVLIRHDILFDYARSPIVDDRLPQPENVARLERLRSFLADGTRLLRGDRKFALIELPSSPGRAAP